MAFPSHAIQSGLPPSKLAGLVPTLNNKGYMTLRLDPYSQAFVEQLKPGQHALEVGAAYGIATIEALKKGAYVTANDIEQKHLDILAQNASMHRHLLTCKAGAMPDIDFAPNYFDSILCCRILHFLKDDDAKLSIRKMKQWLKPNGTLYLVIDTPYFGAWRSFKSEYERRKSLMMPSPSLMEPFSDFLAPDADRSVAPAFLNPFDLDRAIAWCTEAGFKVENSSYLDRQDFPAPLRLDGRESAGIIARRID